MVQNVGAFPAYCQLGSSATGITSSKLLPASGGQWAIAPGAATQITCEGVGGTTTINTVGGSGLAVDIGGVSSGGGGTVAQGNAGSNAQAWWTQIGDASHGPAAVKAASTAAVATDPALVVGLSPNSLLPAFAATPTVTAAQATAASLNATVVGTGTFATQLTGATNNINNISGTVSLPTGAATAALQTTGNATLSTLNTNLGSPFQAGGSIGNTSFGISGTLPAFAATPTVTAAQATAASLNATVVGTGTFPTQLTGATNNINNISGTVSLPTGAATAALQTTGNTTLSTINTTLNAPFQAGGSIGNTSFGISGTLPAFAATPTVTAAQATAASLNATVVGTGTFATQLTGATNNINNISGTVSLPTGAATAALQTTGNTTLSTINTTLGSPFQAGGSIGNTSFGISGTLPAFAATPTVDMNSAQLATLGQQVAGNSLSAIQTSTPDLYPATVNITAADAASTSSTSGQQDLVPVITGTPTANSAAMFTLNGTPNACFSISGTWSGSLAFEDSGTVGASFSPHALNTDGNDGVLHTAVTGNGTFCGVFGSHTNVRVRATAFASGTATVRLTATYDPGAVHTENTALYSNVSIASITRPANTTTYTANTGWNNATSAASATFSFANACRSVGGGVIIAAADIYSSANPTLKLTGNLWLFSGVPGTLVNDDATFNIASADYANLTGGTQNGISFALATAQGTGASNSGTTVGMGIGNHAQCPAGTANLTGMVEVTNAYVPVSGEVLTIKLHTIAVN